MSTILNLCQCCDDCFSQIITGCPSELEFNIPDLPDQTLSLYFINVATNRVVLIQADAEDGLVLFNLEDINLAQGQTYKAHLRDESGAVVFFEQEDEEYNCYQFRYEFANAN